MGTLILAALLQWTFTTDIPGQLPAGWQVRGNSRATVYQIRVDADGNRYLAADSRNSDVQLGTAVNVKPQDFPTLSWRWRVWEFPQNANERNIHTLDSAASIYVAFGSRLFPRIIKYVWSTTEPVGSTFKHPTSGRVAIVVVASGAAGIGQWQIVTRNVAADHKAAFGSEAENIIALGLKTDSDSTASSARADYDDIRLER